MAITGTADLITAVQTELYQASASDLLDEALRSLLLGWAETVVADYWFLHPWRERSASDSIEFDTEGTAALPADFASWRDNHDAVVWPDLRRSLRTGDATRIDALRRARPDLRGEPVMVGVVTRTILRYPRPRVAPELAQVLYLRTPPALTDANEEGGLDQIDPAHYRAVLFEGMRWQVYKAQGDARENAAFQVYRQAAARLWTQQALDNQPRRLGRGYLSHSWRG